MTIFTVNHAKHFEEINAFLVERESFVPHSVFCSNQHQTMHGTTCESQSDRSQIRYHYLFLTTMIFQLTIINSQIKL